METKKCSKCGDELPFEEFYPVMARSGRKSRLSSHCKTCIRKKVKQYQTENVEMVAKKSREYAERHKEEIAAYQKQYRIDHAERKAEVTRRRYLAKKEEILEASRQYYIDNKEAMDLKSKEYREAHKEDKAEYDRMYRRECGWAIRIYDRKRCPLRSKTPEGREKSRNSAHKRRARLAKATIGFLPENYELALYIDQKGLCFYCNCNLDESGQHVEHMTPISRGGEHSLSNLVLSCPSCNAHKHTKTVEEFVNTEYYKDVERI